ncbi:DNA-3-methyladenine glycosylase [Nocardioides sp.]|uniref:DNA-3-methyladenine glycosylase n=1 Tax=Nocardioides sp. TaxID=35761 RepID=UPI003D0B97FD
MPELLEALAHPAPQVAPVLLGARLSVGGVTLRLTEVEAYGGADDAGSHAFRRTPRSDIMFGPPGRLYCYLSYGIHVCANVVTGRDGEAGAVLLRAGEVTEGVEIVRTRRPGVADHRLASGPGVLCRALGIELPANGTDLTRGPIRLELDPEPPTNSSAGPRVGLRQAATTPWRFWLPGEPTVTRYRAALARGRGRDGA